jgi:hypothetical protein
LPEVVNAHPLMLRTDANLGGLPVAVFDQIRDGLARDRSQFYEDLSFPSTARIVTVRRCRRASETPSG